MRDFFVTQNAPVLRGHKSCMGKGFDQPSGPSAACFGHLSGDRERFPVLTEVYYVVSQTNPETKPGESKQVNNVLVKRGKELHEPDRAYLNPTQIFSSSPWVQNSKVAQLIAQASH